MSAAQAVQPRLLVFIPAYDAESTIDWVLGRIPDDLCESYQVHVLVIDDASSDRTAVVAREYFTDHHRPFGHTILVSPQNRGYGGNQKLGYTFASRNGFDYVVMVHGDGQYPPEDIGRLVAPLEDPGVGAVFGSRFLRPGAARAGGMPRYKFAGNRMLTWLQNRMLGLRLSEFHSGFRAYDVRALTRIPFHLNADDFHFDTEIIIQLTRAGYVPGEVDIATHYGDEVCHVNGMAYGANVLGQSLRAAVHDKGLFYEAKYDVADVDHSVARYRLKTDFVSPSTLAADRVHPGDRVLDIGSGFGGMAELLGDTNEVFGIDREKPPNLDRYSGFVSHDLDSEPSLPADLPDVDVIVMLDVIEHLRDPERFVRALHSYCQRIGTVKHIIVSTGNVGFVVVRAALLAGQFNYGSRGILDRTHTRLFTYGSFKRLFRQEGFRTKEIVGVPVPFPLAVHHRAIANLLILVNKALIRINKRLFAYQILLQVVPPDDQIRLLDATTEVSVSQVTG